MACQAYNYKSCYSVIAIIDSCVGTPHRRLEWQTCAAIALAVHNGPSPVTVWFSCDRSSGNLSGHSSTVVTNFTNAAAYDQLHARIWAAVKPIDIIDEMFIADIVFLE
jgi:hypothetical protein